MTTQCVPAPENNRQNGVEGNWLFGVNGNLAAQTPLPSPESTAVHPSPKLTAVVYTIEEAAAVLNVCTKTIRRLIARRHLTCCKALRKKLIPRSQIEGFLKATCDVPMGRF
jgi:excisionase family DNA binding protein